MHRIAGIAGALLLVIARSSSAQEADFGNRIKGGPYDVLVYVENASCPGTHQVKVSVSGAPWLTLKEPTIVAVAQGATETVKGSLDLRTTAAGPQSGTLIFTCLDCNPAACRQSVTTVPVLVRALNAVATFGDSVQDKNFDGLVGGQPVDICVLLANVLNDIGKTAFGTGPRGSKIIAKLNAAYMDNNCSDITFTATTEEPDKAGKPKSEKKDPLPGNASYVKTARFGNDVVGWIYSEEIEIGIDETLTGIECARGSPKDYYVFTHNGKLGVVKKSDLVHTIIHEGLHALNAGKDFVKKPQGGGDGASIEEENDGFKAGDEACTAMGLPPTNGSAGKGYNAGSNPAYTPVK